MRIECVRDTSGLLKLEAEWRALLPCSAADAVFLSWEWVSTWWEVFGAGFSPCVLVARDGGDRPCGIAPFMIGRGRGKARVLRQLMFIGQEGDTTSEYLDFIVAAGREAEVVPAFVRHLLREVRGWDALALENVRTDSACLPVLEGELRALRPERSRPQPSAFLALPGSWDEVLRARSKHFRKQFQYGRNQMAREGEVETLIAGRDLPLDECLDHLAALNRDRWGDAGQSFRTERYLAFHRRLAQRLHARDALQFFFLRVAGRLVGARYDFVYGGKAWSIQGGWLREFEGASLGQLVQGRAIELAIERGCREYDFLAGDSEHKRRWSSGERTLTDLWAARAWRARAFRAARDLRARYRAAKAARGGASG